MTARTDRKCVRAGVAVAAVVLFGRLLPAFDRNDLPVELPGGRPPVATAVDLHSLPVAGQILEGAAQALAGGEIDVALLGDQKFMLNDCLGMWFQDLSTALLVTNLNSPAYYRVLHDNMPLEEDAMRREEETTILAGKVLDGASVAASSEVAAGAEVIVQPAGASATEPVTRAAAGAGGDYVLFLAAGAYDLHVRPAGGALGLVEPGLQIQRDQNGDGQCDYEYLDLDLATAGPDEPPTSPAFIRGEVTGDGSVDISDSMSTLAWLFSSGAAPGCEKAADVNDDGRIDIADPLALLGYLFLGGNEPPSPFPAPGEDPTADDLSCAGI